MVKLVYNNVINNDSAASNEYLENWEISLTLKSLALFGDMIKYFLKSNPWIFHSEK